MMGYIYSLILHCETVVVRADDNSNKRVITYNDIFTLLKPLLNPTHTI